MCFSSVQVRARESHLKHLSHLSAGASQRGVCPGRSFPLNSGSTSEARSLIHSIVGTQRERESERERERKIEVTLAYGQGMHDLRGFGVSAPPTPRPSGQVAMGEQRELCRGPGAAASITSTQP